MTLDLDARIRELTSEINFMTGGYAGDELEELVEQRAAADRQEPSMMPTIGRIVLVPAGPDQNNGADTAPAVITRVWSETCINVRVLLDGPETPWRTSVTYVEDLADATHSHAWTWPPRV